MTSKSISASKKILLLFLIFSLPGLTHASLIITGTRVIYESTSTGKSVEISSSDDFPNIVQAWIDADENSIGPGEADAPFIVTPTIARVDPMGSQTLRVLYTGNDLPSDRESIFYLNVLQIPPSSSEYSNTNHLQFLLRNQIKFFYRPSGLKNNPTFHPDSIAFTLVNNGGHDWAINVENTSPYYASFSGATVTSNGRAIDLQTTMLAPYSKDS
ncbi:fimbrial biogenesis chaperone [Halomonas hibernica]|uniref:fimbrial biogenesis chaperone n=1 Tax=Halomonas hibernica TaxID=2591147 RepID=UPI0015524742|nr:molecular chaperone [Halomonas hibernica]